MLCPHASMLLLPFHALLIHHLFEPQNTGWVGETEGLGRGGEGLLYGQAFHGVCCPCKQLTRYLALGTWSELQQGRGGRSLGSVPGGIHI